MLTINQKFPEFELHSSLPNELLGKYSVKYSEDGNLIHNNDGSTTRGRWMVIFGYPLDFTFVCPTELEAFNEIKEKLDENYDANLLAFSTDSHFSHLGWRKADSRIENLSYPMLGDPAHKLTKALGVLDEENGVAMRATFIVDDMGVIRHVSVNDDSVGRNPSEVLRILDRLQTDELCAACSLGDTVGEEIDLGGYLNE